VEERCTKCHWLENIQRSGYSAEGWKNTISMMRNVGAQLKPSEADTVVAYLAQGSNFVGRLDPKAGAIKMARSPTPRSRPCGMQIDANDVPWFVEFGTNKVSRIDRDTMAIHEYTLPNRDARPRVSRSRPTARSGTPTTRAARWVVSILQPAT